MKKNFPQLIIVLLIIVNGYMFFKFKNKDQENQSLTGKVKTTDKLLLDFKEKLINDFIIGKESENLNLPPLLKLVNLKGDTVLVKDVFTKNSIVLRYSVLNCGECVDAEFEVIKNNAKLFSEELVIITYYERIRGLINMYRKLEKMGLKKLKIYMVPDDKLGIPIDKYNIPSYFHIDKNLKMTNFFIPDKMNAKLSEAYLKLTLRNFFNKKIN